MTEHTGTEPDGHRHRSADELGVVRTICWRDLCPWTELFRVFRVAVSLQLLMLGFLGAWAMSVGWQLVGSVLLTAESERQPAVVSILQATSAWPGARSVAGAAEPSGPSPRSDDSSAPRATNLSDANSPEATDLEGMVSAGSNPSRPVGLAGRHIINFRMPDGSPLNAASALVTPVRTMMTGDVGWRERLFCFLGTIWNLIVWAVVGGAITRTAAVRLGRDERVGLRESLMFAANRFASYLGSPLMPLLTIGVLGIPLVVLGFLMRLNVGMAVAGLLWLPAGVLGFTMALFAIGVLFGWPLMWSAISSEGSDAFDGISRAFAYTFQRPLHYLFYASIALALGLLGALIVQLTCQLIVMFTMQPAVLGMGPERFAEVRAALASGEAQSWLLRFGGSLVNFFNNCFFGIQRAYSFSYLWVASACIYLLLRRDADQTELDAVYVEECHSETYGLPTLTDDDVSGVPSAD